VGSARAGRAGPGHAGAVSTPGRRGRDAVVVTPYPDGPLLVRGDVDIVGPDGTILPRRRRTIALCRCGLSALKPFCDGSHKAAGFRA
jgi:Iron-binding zinc finger CDGSH type